MRVASFKNTPSDTYCMAKSPKGALTVEAALILPLVLCAFFSVIFVIKTVCTYGLIQHAIDETASEIASSSYIYHISGIRDLHDTVRDGIDDRSEVIGDQIGSVLEAYETFSEIGSGVRDKGLKGAGEDIKTVQDAKQSFSEIFGHAEDIMSDPMNELKSIAFYIAGGVFDDIKTELFIPITKLYMKKYLASEYYDDVDGRLRALGIANGFDGLDFSSSSFLSDRDENIDIVVRYRIKLPIPFLFHNEMEFVQRAKVKAWMGGDENRGALDGITAGEEEDIWSLGNFQRGLKFRRMFGANLPNSFPVIARYENGKAVMIKSMDLTAASYQTASNTEKTLKGYINELSGYNGQDKPWGSGNIVIKGEDIREKELLLIIPENDPGQSNNAVLLNMKEYARSKGVSLVIERYGMKKLPENPDTAGQEQSGQDKAGQ